MRVFSIFLAGALAASFAGAAIAQPVTDDASVRLQLARQLFDITGGTEAANTQIKAMFATTTKIVTASVPADQTKLVVTMEQDLQDEMLKMVPSMIDAGVQSYADKLTAQELRDYIAWMSSDSGKAVVQKMPAVRQDILDRETPMIEHMLPALQQKVADRVCDEVKCTAQEREIVDSAMAKALGSHSS